MHFSKTYTQLLLSLPPELRENAIEYRQLKKLINQIVRELSSLGLSPDVLQELLENTQQETDDRVASKGKKRADDEATSGPDETDMPTSVVRRYGVPRVVYEVTGESGRIGPQLRLWVDAPIPSTPPEAAEIQEVSNDSRLEPVVEDDLEDDDCVEDGVQGPHMSLLWALQRRLATTAWDEITHTSEPSTEVPAPVDLDAIPNPTTLGSTRSPNEVVIPLVSDMAFFQMLSDAIEGLSAHLSTVHSNFVDTLENLSRTISDSARPASSTTSFHPYSLITSDPGAIRYPAHAAKSDLYSWREIFQLYVEAEVFESVSESTRGERSVNESEHRLKSFAERVTKRGLGDGRKLKLKQSRAALETFLELNVFILNIKKFQFANAEATRKILKKHTKRTALPSPQNGQLEHHVLLPRGNMVSLPRILVQAVGETLLPVIPHLDDYACLICTSIAFKPIRLNCGHLFCVRCLVKMQKRGSGDCPMCRAPSVLTADRSNVDWALLNFMQDWFPIEAKEKLKHNEKEATREELEELGLDPDQSCIVM